MSVLKKVKVFKDVLQQEDFDEVQKYLLRSEWGLNTSSDNYQTNKIFWGMSGLERFEFFSVTVFDQIKKLVGNNFELDNILANAQSMGQDGSPHYDNNDPRYYTFILYSNPEWDYQWGGQTVFFDRYVKENTDEQVTLSDETKVIYPIPNTAAFFPANIYHYGISPSRDFYGMRYSLAFRIYKTK